MAYLWSPIISLKRTVHRVMDSPLETLEFAYAELKSLKEFLQGFDSSIIETVNALDVKIRDAVYNIEHVLDQSHQFLSHSVESITREKEVLDQFHYEETADAEVPRRRCSCVNVLRRVICRWACTWSWMKYETTSNQLLPQSEEERLEDASCIDSEQVRQEINSLTEMVEGWYIKESLNLWREQVIKHDDAGPSRVDSDGKKSKIVIGLSDQVNKIMSVLMNWKLFELLFVSLVGMEGIGKTTLAEEIFEHPSILKRFDCRVWVSLGPKYQSKNLLLDILSQIGPHNMKEMRTKREEMFLVEHLSEFLVSNRCLFVLDDVWNREVLDYLQRLSPNMKNGSVVLVTTSLEEVAVFPKSYRVHKMRLLDKDESWCLLREKIFAQDQLCPPELEKPGKKIAEICEDLPLTILAIADLLSIADKSPEYWKKVAEKKNSVFMDAYEEISKVLVTSYDYLPQHLKALFLYMGVFPEKYAIPHSKLINLWIAEGFFETNLSKTSEDVAGECLKDLISRSIVMVRHKSSSNGIKTCGLHSAFWHLCIKQARKNSFFHVMEKYADSLAGDVKIQQRLCIHNNILFGIKDVYDLMASNSTMCSLLCTGPHHQYPVSIYFASRLLRTVDALSIRFYEFPIELVRLVELRYLALTYSGKLPSSISELRNLQCLIVGRHLSIIKSSGDPPCLPMEIWDMQKLKHLQLMGSDLPDPCSSAVLSNLSTLSGVSAYSCTKNVLETIPNIKKLGIQIELTPYTNKPFTGFDHISNLHRLETLKCVIMNPMFMTEVVTPPSTTLSMFPLGLKKLSLSGLGCCWEDMSKIALLPNLEVLKLRCYAFRGPKWEVEGNRFLRLEFLLIEDSDLMHWTAGNGSFPFLHSLIIKHCYNLEEVPRKFSFSLGMIEVVDCNPSIVNWAKNLEKFSDVRIHSSWDDRNLKS